MLNRAITYSQLCKYYLLQTQRVLIILKYIYMIKRNSYFLNLNWNIIITIHAITRVPHNYEVKQINIFYGTKQITLTQSLVSHRIVGVKQTNIFLWDQTNYHTKLGSSNIICNNSFPLPHVDIDHSSFMTLKRIYIVIYTSFEYNILIMFQEL